MLEIMREAERVLVVEDNRSLLRTLGAALRERFRDVRCCRTVAEATRMGMDWRPDLMVLDFQLPDGDARAVLDSAALYRPMPAVVAISGAASPVDGFELAQRGVRAFLAKPLMLEQLERAIDVALTSAPAIDAIIRQGVGHRGLAEATEQIRAVMIDEALARSDGSRRGAARLLRTSRQLLQYLIRRR
jgi:DNA-binding NtrC family response regulator